MLKSHHSLTPDYKSKLFSVAKNFNHVVWMDSHKQSGEHGVEDVLVALGKNNILTAKTGNAFSQLNQYLSGDKWAFGFLAYDLKNEVEGKLKSENHDGLGFPELCFFEPQVVIKIKGGTVEIQSSTTELVEQVSPEGITANLESTESDIVPEIKSRLSKEQYIAQLKAIKERIARGDVYEMNFCHEFYVENCEINPFSLHQKLVKQSPTPFSSFFKIDDQYVMCASPERFLQKKGDRIISQPIKGTAKRGASQEEDEVLKAELSASSKERSENIMIVDLVRNDLSQLAEDGSVQVDELCKIYSFPQVHQMISTVSCKADKKYSNVQLIEKCFPMGSMTGAPKVKAMELIEEYEATKRGVYSGSIGYFAPNGDFDFNVVIRSILYNKSKKYLSFSVGGAITHHSDPEKEYEESLLKAKAIFEVLQGS